MKEGCHCTSTSLGINEKPVPVYLASRETGQARRRVSPPQGPTELGTAESGSQTWRRREAIWMDNVQRTRRIADDTVLAMKLEVGHGVQRNRQMADIVLLHVRARLWTWATIRRPIVARNVHSRAPSGQFMVNC